MRTISTSACVAEGPAIEMARSPDSRVSRNASVITVNATSRPRTRRRAIRRNIYKSPVPAGTQRAFSGRRSKRNGVTKPVSRAREPDAFIARACCQNPGLTEGSIRIPDCDECNVHANAQSNFQQGACPGEARAIEEIRASSASLVQELGRSRTDRARGPLLGTPRRPFFERSGRQVPACRCIPVCGASAQEM